MSREPPEGQPDGAEAERRSDRTYRAVDPRIRAVIDRAPPLRSALLDEVRDLLPPVDRQHRAGTDAA